MIQESDLLGASIILLIAIIVVLVMVNWPEIRAALTWRDKKKGAK